MHRVYCGPSTLERTAFITKHTNSQTITPRDQAKGFTGKVFITTPRTQDRRTHKIGECKGDEIHG